MPIIILLCHPQKVKKWETHQWDELLQQAYSTGLVGRIYSILSNAELFAFVPDLLQWHFTSAHTVFLAHKHDVLSEIGYIEKALKPAGIHPVFLKGSAYILAGAKCSQGRLFADIDIFVSKKELPATEEILRWSGWAGKKMDKHDEKYYRDWMHEIPPMTNTRTGMTIDVHHNLVPVVSRMRLNSEKIFSNVMIDNKGVKTLSAEDKVLHSAAHLLLDGEFNHGFRDLHDVYLLIVEYTAKDPIFLSRLQQRSIDLGFELIFFYCLKLQCYFFALSVEDNLLVECEKRLKSVVISRQILKLFIKVLSPNITNHGSQSYKNALFLLFLRAHWLKMPTHILLPHLLYKSFVAPFNRRKFDTIDESKV
jgi:hypothetical protein